MTSVTRRILVIDPDPAVRRFLTALFETNGYRVIAGDTGELGILQARSHRPDICIVDPGPPDHGRLSFIRWTRAWSPVPIIVLTACAQEVERLAAFEAGADDYIIKPVSGQELIARTRAILRRILGNHRDAVLRLGDAVIDLGNRVTRGPDGQEVRLTPIEHRILECLVRHSNGVVTHAQIMQEVWGPFQTDVRSLRIYVANLRRKLERKPAFPKYILTQCGVGYRLATQAGHATSIADVN